VECSPSKCPAKALISFQEHAAPRVLLNIKHQQHFFLMIACIPNGYQRKNDNKKWGSSKNKEPAPVVKQILFLQICPPVYARNFSPVHYIHTVVHEHQCFFWRNFASWRGKKNSGESNKGLLGNFLEKEVAIS